jgi:CBS domain-containing protein
MKITTKVSELMSTDVARCTPGESLARAAQAMWERDCGCVPVTGEDGRLLGMLTDRDLAMACFTQGRGPHELLVAGAMSGTCSSCLASDTLASALRTMAQDQVRRLPVADAEGRLIGLLSLADVLQALARGAPRTRRALLEPMLATLLEITRPRHGEGAVLVPAEPKRARRKAGAGPAGKQHSAHRKAARRGRARS